MRLISCLLLAAGAVACSSTQSGEGPRAGPQPSTQNEPMVETEVLTAAQQLEMLDTERAQALVAELESEWPLLPDHPLQDPQSVDDVEQILKLDQVNLFPGAVKFLESQDSLDALALHGQIELAWGETYMLLMEILMRLHKDFQSAAKEEKETSELAWLLDSTDEIKLRIKAFELVAIEHISKGSAKAEEVIEKHPESYLGYRVVADFYRMMRDWENFEENLQQAKKLNPKSNGVLFLQGAAAFQTDQDRNKAAELYSQAITNDPKFVRAQAHLLIIQSEIQATHAALEKLAQMNPDHQFIAVAGESIREAYAKWQAQGGS